MANRTPERYVWFNTNEVDVRQAIIYWDEILPSGDGKEFDTQIMDINFASRLESALPTGRPGLAQ